MRMFLVVMLLAGGCENERCAPSKGAASRSEIETDDKPTPRFIGCELGGSYDSPNSSTATLEPDRDDVFRWKRFYDGIALEADTVTSKYHDGWITRFVRELAGPERVRRTDLIGEQKAIAAGHRAASAKAQLAYLPAMKNQHLPGHNGDNAADYELVITSWQVVYRVEDGEGGTYVDAYNGGVIRSWSNSIID